MKVLLTAKPRTGKSTIVSKIVNNYHGKMCGIIASEIRDAEGERVGFEARSIDGEVAIFAHKNLIKSDYIVGNKYYVDVDTVNGFVTSEIAKGLTDSKQLVIIDEIGKMQAFSEKFLSTCLQLFDSKNSILGTILIEDEEWALPFKQHKNTILINVTEQNRDSLPEILENIFSKVELISKFSASQQKLITKLITDYLNTSAFTQLIKLLDNALSYVIEGKVTVIKHQHKFMVQGKHGDHTVMFGNFPQEYSCNCNLYLGKEMYENKKGECSHIQAVKIATLKEN